MNMVIWGMLAWWYTEGWHRCVERIVTRVEATLDFFSISLLFKTLFAPFRQISAGTVRGPLNIQLQAFIDRVFSRFIGAFVRLIMICIGSVVIALNLLVGLLLVVAWVFVPALPLVGLLLFMIGWLPWQN